MTTKKRKVFVPVATEMTCYDWLKQTIVYYLSVPDEEFNRGEAVAKTGWLYIHTKQYFTSDEIDEELKILESELNVDLLWSTSSHSLSIKKRK